MHLNALPGTNEPKQASDSAWHIGCNTVFRMEQTLLSQTACLHCGTYFETVAAEKFCCSGCRFVYGIFNEQGLGHYYELRNANPPPCPVPAQVSSSTYAFYDDPEVIRQLSSDGKSLRLYIEGVNCTACVWLLEQLPRLCADVDSLNLNMGAGTIDVVKRAQGSFARIAQTLDRFGYRTHPLRLDEDAAKHQLLERRQDLVRIGVAGAMTGNIMILAVSLYGGATGELASQFSLLSALLSLPVLTYCAWPFYRSTVAAFNSRRLNIDVPIVFAILAGVAASLWSLFSSRTDVYFDSLSMLVFLLLSSRFALRNVQVQHLQATNLESEFLFSTVSRVLATGGIERIASLALKPGDVIQIEPGSVIPADGIVISGEGTISTAVLTGESEPVPVKKDTRLEAGSHSLEGVWCLEVQNPPGKTRLSGILRETEKAAQWKSNVVRFADKISQGFIGTVFALAIALVIAFFPGDLHEGVARALALIIVTCPCVFGIAIPLSMNFAIREAARKGLIIKNADAIERLWKVTDVIFDKTGTLTRGEMAVTSSLSTDPSAFGIALTLEQNQQHPIARAIANYLQNKGVIAVPLENITPVFGGGVQGTTSDACYRVQPIATPLDAGDKLRLRARVGVFRNDVLIAEFELGDEIRTEALGVLKQLRYKGYGTHLLSGDRAFIVESCARALEFAPSNVYAQVTPEEKAMFVRASAGQIVMVGDGANDAAALASATVGVAVSGSLDVSLRAADVYLARPDLRALPELLSLAGKTKRAIQRNLFFSVSFNVVSGTLAICGLMTPLWAAVLMPLSSLVVLISATWTGQRLFQRETRA